ncbi:Hypothetical_protein [Hexamita inflata]|uniref:Hypothetical_protein n=1 Tax=Hexamita inflata TaxID=28002 RepID=A0ABP1GKZ5_9EUKA
MQTKCNQRFRRRLAVDLSSVELTQNGSFAPDYQQCTKFWLNNLFICDTRYVVQHILQLVYIITVEELLMLDYALSYVTNSLNAKSSKCMHQTLNVSKLGAPKYFNVKIVLMNYQNLV